METTITSKPIDHVEHPFINVDDQKQVDHNNIANTSFHMPLVDVMDELILENTNDNAISILEPVQSDNVNVESRFTRPNLATLEHMETIASIAHNDLETNDQKVDFGIPFTTYISKSQKNNT